MLAKKIFEREETRNAVINLSSLTGFKTPFLIDSQTLHNTPDTAHSLLLLIEINSAVKSSCRYFSAFNILLMDTLDVDVVLIDREVLKKHQLNNIVKNSLDFSADDAQIEKYFSEKPHLEEMDYKQLDRNDTFLKKLSLAKKTLEKAKNAVTKEEVDEEPNPIQDTQSIQAVKPVFYYKDSAFPEEILDNLLHEENLPYVKLALLRLLKPEQITEMERWVNAKKREPLQDTRTGSELPAFKKRKY